MKIMFISDIHGIKTNIRKVEEKFNELKCDKLVVLGDLFYIGPRNKMNSDYDIKEVMFFLNSHKNNIICVKGNCDSDVDQMVCEFPISKESLINVDGLDIYLTHGDIHNENNWERENSILAYGHFHIPFIKEKSNSIFLNPGSISLPKDDFDPTYMVYDNRKFTIYDINDNKIAEKEVTLLEK